jgi:hypothetical protein
MFVAVRGRCCILLLYRRATRLVRRRGEVRGTDPATFRFSGRTYPQLAQIVRELCAVAGRWCLPLVAAVAVTVAVSPGQDALPGCSPGVRLVTARMVEGMAPHPGQARCLTLLSRRAAPPWLRARHLRATWRSQQVSPWLTVDPNVKPGPRARARA